MSQPDYYAVAIVISILAFLIAAANFWRAGRWRDSDDGRELDEQMTGFDKRLSAIETKVLNLATKGDVDRLTAEIRGLERETSRVGGGVQRIENYLLERTK